MTKLEELLASLTDDEELQKRILEVARVEANLSARQEFTAAASLVEDEIKRLRKLKAYEQIRNESNCRTITLLSTEIAESYITNALRERFAEELELLGFKQLAVTASTRGKQGAQMFKLSLVDAEGTKLPAIASEGEQKCLALAGLLAELKADERNSTIIFDDPVTSLDHRWRMRFAKRVVEESLVRQVVVFTHDIVYLKFLCEQAELISGAEIHINSLERGKDFTGVVRGNPPWDALTTSKRIQALNEIVRELRKMEESATEDECKELGKKFYGLLREAWERLVEERLLNKVVERFSREVRTQRLKCLHDITEDDISLVNEAMGKCSALFSGHDSAPALGEPVITAAELTSDLEKIEKFHAELCSKKRKRS